jgi:hypothetical protein
MTPCQEAILHEIYTALVQLDAGRELLAIVGSWGNTLSDDEVLEALRRLNAGRSLFHEG